MWASVPVSVSKKPLGPNSLRGFLYSWAMRFSMEQLSSYYQQNKAERLAYEQEYVTCPCGYKVKRQGLSSHRKHSPSHKIWADMMKSLEAKQQAQQMLSTHDWSNPSTPLGLLPDVSFSLPALSRTPHQPLTSPLAS